MGNITGQLRLPRLISDGMVLQRDAEVKIWGWAAAGEEVAVEFIGEVYTAATGIDGKWSVTLSGLKAGGPFCMQIKADNSITIKDILVGDIWVCSGQSNMKLPIARVIDICEDEIACSYNKEIRQFLVPERYDFNTPQQDLQAGSWEYANPKSVMDFSAAGYFFARTLYEKYHIPIGLINASVGGTPAEAWLSEDALKEFPDILQKVIKYKDDNYIDMIKKGDETATNEWYHRLEQQDKGMAKGEPPWYEETCNTSGWSVMKVPTRWSDVGLCDFCGVVWFRKEISIPASMAGKPARLRLGAIVNSDTTYVNGIPVGSTAYRYPPRKYEIAENVLKEGKNVIAIRAVSNKGEGEFIRGKAYELSAEGNVIDLKGEWQYKVGAVDEPLPDVTFIQYEPLGLFNGMIAPLLNYTIKGVIWYQGESNTSKPMEYRRLFSALIADWRQKWNEGDFPFLYVQLANYMESKVQPSESSWAELREAQLETLAVPNTGMVVALDIGEWNDLHPLNKKDIGCRLALAARKITYGEDVICSGPLYHSMSIEGNRIVIEFSNTGDGLVVKYGMELKHFAIAGADKKFVWAEAEIKGNKVVVWSGCVANPVAVRYAWADNPEGANLYNKNGLPASAFRAGDA